MPAPKKIEAAPKEKKDLQRYTVFVNGEDRTIMAEDEDDRDRQIANMKATFPA